MQRAAQGMLPLAGLLATLSLLQLNCLGLHQNAGQKSGSHGLTAWPPRISKSIDSAYGGGW